MRPPYCRTGVDARHQAGVPRWKRDWAALWAADSYVVGFIMVLHLVRVLALLMAACLAPSLAYAHAGHAHSHAPVAQDVPAAAGHHDQGRIVAPAVVTTAVVSTARSADDPAGCGSHCCSGVLGMPCCGAVLVPEIATAPDATTWQLVRFGRADTLRGFPPKALPKPPKFLG
jgi:hypothetical protein